MRVDLTAVARSPAAMAGFALIRPRSEPRPPSPEGEGFHNVKTPASENAGAFILPNIHIHGLGDAVDAAGAPADGTVTLGRWNAGVRGQGREALFSRTQGGMVSYTFGEREFVLRRPSITTFRPLTDNDRGAGHAFERAAWAVAGKYARCVDCAIAVSYTHLTLPTT